MKESKEVFTAQDWKDLDEFEMERAYWVNRAKQKPCDTLIQHKWPEDVPEKDGYYLVLESVNDDDNDLWYRVEYFGDNLCGDESGRVWVCVDVQWMPCINDSIKYWWNLPKIKE